MRKKPLHLVCNAHLDPVWLWEWEEGLAETLSTFRIAAEFCEKFNGFVFCHNEAVLYKWVEEYEPALFNKIQNLIKKGSWKIIGGWYIQPDCNIPSGESFVRQILLAHEYFVEKFNVEPRTAVNLDPFGHSRGLVQILEKSGYNSYLFCRPDEKGLKLPANDFIWSGYAGSKIIAHRAPDHYNSRKGKATEKINNWINNNKDKKEGMLLWGIGNHGGGPSREDLEQIEILKQAENLWDIKHSYPEEYFNSLKENINKLPVYDKDLNPWAVGCYTSMSKVKKKHSIFENTYYFTEKILTHAFLNDLMEYPGQELQTALEDLLFCEFHDILPGTAIKEVEAYSIQKLDHGLEILSKLRSRAFFSLLSGFEKAKNGEFPIFVYNPHPYDIEEVIICELQPPEPNFNKDVFLLPEVYDNKGNKIEYQLEKESCNIQTDQRKRLVFKANLMASSMNRFSCSLKEVKLSDKPVFNTGEDMTFKNNNCEIKINKTTGLIDRYRIDGKDYLKNDSIKLLVMKDYADPWGMKVNSFRNIEGEFRLKTGSESAKFAAVNSTELEPVRIIEDGKIRTVIEALFEYNNSSACIRYIIPKTGGEMEIQIRLYWMEKDRMLKLSIPTTLEKSNCYGQVAYGVQCFDRPEEELIAQKWICLTDHEKKHTFSVINDGTYGFDYYDGELRISMLRSPAYAGHPVDDVTPIVRQDRFEERIDQGERFFRFWVNAGEGDTRLSAVDIEAQVKNENFMTLCCYPMGSGNRTLQSVILSNKNIKLSALKLAENKKWLIIRLFEPTGVNRKTDVNIPSLGVKFETVLTGSEIKTIGIDLKTKEVFELDLMEEIVTSDE